MKKALKVVGIVVAVLVVLLVGLLVLARIVITPERIQAVLLPRAEEALHREITLAGIDVSLFTGITLDDLVVREKEGEEPFVAADRVVLRYQLWPLIFRRVVVDEMRLVEPRIRIERLADGTFNFTDLLKTSKPQQAAAPADADGGTPVDLLVSQVSLEKGEILFIDHRVGEEAPLRYEITSLEMAARDISLARPFPLRLGGEVAGGEINLEGTVDPQQRQVAATASVKGLEMDRFAPYYRGKVPGQVNRLVLNLQVTAEGGPANLVSRGEISLAPIDLVLAREGKEALPIRDASLRLAYDVQVEPDAGRLSIRESTLTYNGIPLEVKGEVTDYAQAPKVDLQAVLPPLEIGKALAAVPPEFVAELAALQPSGQVSARLDLAGAVAEPMKLLQQGEIHLSPVEAQVSGARLALRGVLHLAGDTLRSEKLVAILGENQAAIDLRAENLFGDIIRVTSAVQAERFAIDPLLGAAAAPAAAGQQEAATAPGKPLDLPVAARGTVQIGQTLYKGLSVSDFDLRYRLEDNVVTIEQMQGKVAQGTFGIQARADLGKAVPTYTSQLNLQGIQADPLLSAFWPKAAGTVFGTLNFQGALEGAGTEPAVLKRNLSSKGEIRLADGRLTGAGLVQGLAEFLDLEELRVLQFSQAGGSYTIQKGKLRIDSAIDGKDLRLQPQGTVDLDGFSLDLALNLKVAPALAGRIRLEQVGRFLADPQGWTQVPLKVAGTVDSPRFILDTSALGQKVKEKAGEEIRQRLQEQIEKRLAPGTTQPAEPGTEPPKSRPGVEETLRGLFGR